jgi:hypothetical protein
MCSHLLCLVGLLGNAGLHKNPAACNAHLAARGLNQDTVMPIAHSGKAAVRFAVSEIAQDTGRQQTPIGRCGRAPHAPTTVVKQRRFYPQTWCCAPARWRQLVLASQGARAHSRTLRTVWKAISAMEGVKWS